MYKSMQSNNDIPRHEGFGAKHDDTHFGAKHDDTHYVYCTPQ